MEPWREYIRDRQSRERWTLKKMAAGLCKRCGRNRPAVGRTCDPCRDRDRKRERKRWQRKQGKLKSHRLPTDKQLPALTELQRRGPATAAELARRLWPGRDPRAAGQATRLLHNLEQRTLVHQVNGTWQLTEWGRKVEHERRR